MEQEKIRVLYLDDEPNNLTMFRAGFRLDYEIFTALTAEEAFQIIRKQKLHIVIADQRMPHITGIEFLKQLLHEDPNPVRILLTGYSNLEAVISAINHGQVFRYIKKPWDDDDIRMTIENAYEIYNARQTLKRKNDELTKINMDLVRINDELNQFVYSASHDLKAPLASIMGIVQIARMEGEEDELERYLSWIEKSVQQLEIFIENIIDYYKNTRYEANLIEIDFQSLIQEMVESFQFHPQIPDIHFDIKIEQNHPFINDEFRLRLILNNLISNAIKYQRKDETQKKISIYIHVTQTYTDIYIGDNGIGISEQYIKNIYKMFFRATETAHGSGIGLYIVKEAIEKMDGTIQVISKEGEGTTFTISLPNQKYKETMPLAQENTQIVG